MRGLIIVGLTIAAVLLLELLFGTNYPPICDANGPYSANVGEVITFDGSITFDPDGDQIYYEWGLRK